MVFNKKKTLFLNFFCFSDEGNFIEFNDLLFSALKRVYAKDIYKNAQTKTKQYLYQIEKKTKEEIDEIIKNKKLSTLGKFRQSILEFTNSPQKKKEEISNKLNKKFLNTLITTLYCKISFRAWKKFGETQLATKKSII